MGNVMKAISLWQPWASLMAHGRKTIETRSWKTSYRGPLLIHAAQRPMEMIHSEAVCDFDDLGVNLTELPYGCLVCQVDLVDVKLILNGWVGRETSHSNFTSGRWAWITENLEIFEPIPYKGRQGLFNVPEELLGLEAN